MPTSTSHEKPRLLDVAAWLAVLPFVAAAVRVWMYSGGDMSVFLTLLRTLDIPALLVATSIQLLPIVVLVTFILVLTDWQFRDRARALVRSPTGLTAVVAVMLLFTLIYTASLVFAVSLLGVALAVIVYFAVKKFWPWAHRHVSSIFITQRGDTDGPNSLVTFIAVLVIFSIQPTNMWLPLERVDRGVEKLTAYVLSTENEWATLLTKDRRIVLVPSREIVQRDVCRPDGPVTFATLVFPSDLSTAPECN